jgi:colanic acid/amylovoran biosynthesis glycosyltransferase
MVVPAFPKLSETFIVSKFLGLLERGFDVAVACVRSSPAEWDRIESLSSRPELRRRVVTAWPTRPRWRALLLWPIATLWCAAKNPSGLARYLARGWSRFGPSILRRLYLDSTLIASRPDLVHFGFGTLGIGRTWVGRALGCKVVVSFRGFDLNDSGLDRPDDYRDLWGEADALHFLGNDLRRRALWRGCPPDKPYSLIPPAVDLSLFTPPSVGLEGEVAGTSGRPLRIVSVGRLHWKKGYDDALAAVRRLTDLGVCCEYRIVGDGDYLEAVAFACHQLGIAGRVTILGARPPRDVPGLIAWSDVLLHAAVSEGFCNAVIEAQAMARPVVCTDAGGLPENVADGVTGFVVPRRDPDATAEKLALLAADPALRRRLGEAGRRRVEERFDRSRQLDSFVQLYDRTLKGLPLPAPPAGDDDGPEAHARRCGSGSGALR